MFMLGIFIANVVVQYATTMSLRGISMRRFDAILLANDMRENFRKQSETWKQLVIGGRDRSTYGNYFYQLSKYSDHTKDSLYNIKIDFASNRQMVDDTSALIALHNDITKKSVSLIFKAGEMKDTELRKAVNDLAEDDSELNKTIDTLVSNINAVSDTDEFRYRRIINLISIGSLIISLTALVGIAVMILRINRKAQGNIIETGKILNSYLPPQLVTSILQKGSGAIPNLARRNLTVCFTDLQGFTAASEGCEPELIAKIIDHYLTEMGNIAQSWGGMVDKFMGDGVMILFGAFDTENATACEHPLTCVRMAIAMQERMHSIIEEWRADGFTSPLGLRIGIHSGYATIGSIGPDSRKSFTAVGSTVNIASRLEKLCTPGGILIGHETRSGVCSEFECIPREDIIIRGLSRSINVYDVKMPKV
jgi:class 3 adenylate cyclase